MLLHFIFFGIFVLNTFDQSVFEQISGFSERKNTKLMTRECLIELELLHLLTELDLHSFRDLKLRLVLVFIPIIYTGLW